MTVVNEHGIPILGKDDENDVRLIDVCLVSHEQVPVAFTYDLGQLMAFTAAHLPEGVHLGLNLVSGTYVHQARQQMLAAMRERKSTWILWLDTDMRFPRDILIRMIQHRQPVVGINYAKRQVPTEYVALKTVGFGGAGSRLVTDDDSTGLEDVEAVGFGALLIRGDVLQALPPLSEHPWFEMRWNPDSQEFMGEDVAFCQLLRELGYRILVDHDISKECAHIGQFEYRLEHVDHDAVAEAVEAKVGAA